MNFKFFFFLPCLIAFSAALPAQAEPNFSSEGGLASANHDVAAQRPAYLRAIASRLDTPRARIGRLYQGPSCTFIGDLLWDESSFRQLSYRLPKFFRHELQRAHFPVPPLSETYHDQLINHGRIGQYVEVDMLIEDVSADACRQEAGISGQARMRVNWRLYAGAPALLYETTTEGSYRTGGIETGTPTLLLEKAFSAAMKDFLSKEGFLQALDKAAP